MTEQLLNWYQKNKRSLPWRDVQNPYYTYLSEIMLQQTRVDVVKEYFLRFIEELPNFQALSQVEEEKLLHLWQGLGYYQRARRMKSAAEIICTRYDGRLPQDLDELLSLPGVGPYTAGALASIAYDVKAPAIDGNVLRIYARLYLLEGSPTDPSLKQQVQEILLEHLPEENCGDFNQALMDLGATICKPRNPLCKQCPLQEQCLAYREGVQELYPDKSKAKASPIYEKTLLLLHRKNTIGLVMKEEGLLQGLWQFPSIEGHLDPKDLVPSFQNINYLGEKKHIFSHQIWLMKAYEATGELPDLHWVSLNQLQNYPMARAFSWARDLLTKKTE